MHYNSIFISDLHLGAAYAQPTKILEFLSEHTANTLYLLGDIFDDYQDDDADWTTVIEIIKLVLVSDRFQNIIYVPGNHDSIVRYFFGSYGKLHIKDSFVQRIGENDFYLTHGDEYDWVKGNLPILFELISRANHHIRNLILCFMPTDSEAKIGGGINHWLNNIIINNNFFHKLTDKLRKQNLQGVICGHFHEACIDKRCNLTYINCGDWIDSCTAIIENDGEFELINWR